MSKIHLLRHWIWTKSLKDLKVYFQEKHIMNKAIHNRKQIINDYFKTNKIKKLQIGCGFNPIDGWLNTDLAFNEKVAFLDASKKYPFDDETFDYIFTEHLFEHLTFNEELTMLEECFRVLKKGGILRLATPNFDFLIQLYNQKGKIETDYVKWSTNRYVYDVKEKLEEKDHHEIFVINNFVRDWGHQIIHNFSTLDILLKKSGFKNVTLQKVGQSNDPVLNGLEKHGNIIPIEFNELETIVVEAVK